MTHTILNIALALLCLLFAIALVAPPILAATKSNIRPEDVALACMVTALSLVILVSLAFLVSLALVPIAFLVSLAFN